MHLTILAMRISSSKCSAARHLAGGWMGAITSHARVLRTRAGMPSFARSYARFRLHCVPARRSNKLGARMLGYARILRGLAKARFRALGLATIKDIPTDDLRALVAALCSAGWRKTAEYDGFDAWIDYGEITLRRGFQKLTVEWDNWTEGSVEGPSTIIEKIASDFGLTVTNSWRWSDYDPS